MPSRPAWGAYTPQGVGRSNVPAGANKPSIISPAATPDVGQLLAPAATPGVWREDGAFHHAPRRMQGGINPAIIVDRGGLTRIIHGRIVTRSGSEGG